MKISPEFIKIIDKAIALYEANNPDKIVGTPVPQPYSGVEAVGRVENSDRTTSTDDRTTSTDKNHEIPITLETTVQGGFPMTQAKPRFRTIEEFLNYDDGSDRRYELVRGELIEMPNESTLNTQIAVFLIITFAALGTPPTRIGIKQMIAVSSSEVTARDPDLIVHSEESIAAIEGKTQALISADLPAPLLAIEIVSPGEPGSGNYDRDYVEKPREYAARGIPEFWQVDPSRAVVNVLSLENGIYRSQPFRGSDRIVSPTFPNLQLTAEQILQAG